MARAPVIPASLSCQKGSVMVELEFLTLLRRNEQKPVDHFDLLGCTEPGHLRRFDLTLTPGSMLHDGSFIDRSIAARDSVSSRWTTYDRLQA